MNDLDNSLKTLARSVVADAPRPPDFTSLEIAAPSHHRRQRYFVGGAAAASLLGLVGAVAVLQGAGRETRIEASSGQEETATSFSCPAEPPLRITVVGTGESPRQGPAPGAPEPSEGQRVVHWARGDGSIELRWPAEPQSTYASGNSRVSTLHSGGAVYPERLEIDVDPTEVDRDPARIESDIVIEPQSPEPAPGSCDLMEVTAVTAGGRWVAGFRASSRESGQFYEQVDLQPRIIERRAVEVSPTAAIRCQGSDQFGTPANRSGGADLSLRGPAPADVLLAYLAVNPGAVPSGWVEMTEPDGSITYGVDPSGDGWTTLLWLAADDDGWYLDRWTASGC